MRLRVQLVALGLLLPAALSCAPEAAEPTFEGTWVGTITTEGNITTVLNESGSVWGGTATLVEEASIGVESGDDNYMFARLSGVYASGDEIYVADNTPALRVFDYEGNHLRNIGREGQGPGEFQRPTWVAATPDRRVFVVAGRNRINVYGPGPDEVDAWEMGMHMCCAHPMVVTADGVVWIEHGVVNQELRTYDPAWLPHGPDGPGEPLMIPSYDYERWTLRYNDRDIEAIPNAPETIHQMSPTGVLVAGSSDAYRFEIISPDGPKTVVERYWEPIPVSETELDYSRRLIPARYSNNEAGGAAGLDWDGRLPEYKPAFSRFLTTHEGDIWVIRDGPTEDIEGCDPSEMVPPPAGNGPDWPRRCFRGSYIIDAFEGEGRYLGEVKFPGGGIPIPTLSYVRGDTLVTRAEDQAGTIMVKRYRLVLPGQEQ